MSQAISCIIMRGGTSRGPYLKLSELPANRDDCALMLQQIMGSGHELQLDGIGGGNSLTSKVAMVGVSTDPAADVDYLFAQVGVKEHSVDFSPNCGNMLAGVAPFAIETGLVAAGSPVTLVRIRNLNTNKIIHAQVATPNGKICYEGDALISGAPNPAAPIKLTFLDVQGAKTGHLLPTGHSRDSIDNIGVTCIDAATPCVLIRARDLGKTGYESPAELDQDTVLLARIEHIRRQAGQLMGMGDVSNQVIPKPVLLAPARDGGDIHARYFVPHSCHKALAVTGSIAIATACGLEGSVANELARDRNNTMIKIEHPSGMLELEISKSGDDESGITAVSLIRTARKILSGTIFLP
jgi:hypothetical protein